MDFVKPANRDAAMIDAGRPWRTLEPSGHSRDGTQPGLRLAASALRLTATVAAP